MLFVLLSALASGIVAAAGGYFLARTITAIETERRLDDYANRMISDSEAASSELRTVLAALNASTAPACSLGELESFRRLIFESDFILDAGRMSDGKILCSTSQGKRPSVRPTFKPEFTQQDGTEYYTSLPWNKSGEIVLQSGHAFVVFTPYTRMHIEDPPLHYQETAIDAPTQKPGILVGELNYISPAIATNEGIVQVGSDLYATQCSIRFFNCVTAFTTIPQMAQAYWTRFYGCIAACGVLGALLGLAFALAYHRNKSLEQQLRRAITRDKLRVVYQPIVDLKDRRIVGAETLARWTNEEGQVIGPDQFIKIAEEGGFVGEITRLVLRHALRDHAAVLRSDPGFSVGINVAASDLSDPGFLPLLEQSLRDAEVDPAKLTLEITESSTARQEVAKEAIARLRALGHRVNIDDFGTGYSSLAYLHDLAVSAIKIDKVFTQAIGTGAIIVAIIPQILAMAKALDLAVIVEGVETEEQAQYFASQEESIFGQGWLFGRPVPVAVFRTLLTEDRNRRILPINSQELARAKQPSTAA